MVETCEGLFSNTFMQVVYDCISNKNSVMLIPIDFVTLLPEYHMKTLKTLK